jgi:hypothetical protein
MKRSLAASAVAAVMVLAGCGEREPAEAAMSVEDAAVEASATPVAVDSPAPAAPTPAGAVPAAAGAPAFAVIYPGGAPDAPPTMADGPDGPGGIVAFTTDATPAEVIAFYRQRAEAAGLKTINTMNRGASIGYGASGGADGRGQNLSVVATRMEDGPTSVQLSWTAGR